MDDLAPLTPLAARPRRYACLAWLLAASLLASCSVLKPSGTPLPRFFTLGSSPGIPAQPASQPAAANAAAPTRRVLAPSAAAGFDSQRIIYVRQDQQIEYCAHNERVDTEIVRPQHEFQSKPSQVRFTLRATLVDDHSRRVLAWREFDTVAPAASDDPYGGVTAAGDAVQRTLQQLSLFSREAVAAWTPAR